MGKFRTPLELRRQRSERRKKRYRTDPAYRLAAINRTRRHAGRPTLASLDQSDKLRIRELAEAAKPI